VIDCRTGTPLSDEQISAIIDGVADPIVLDHLALCPACARRVQTWQRWEQQLQAHLHRWDCPPSQQLADYHWGITDRPTSQTITRHLESCIHCTAELETLREFLNADMPRAVSTPAPVATPPTRSRWRELVAVLLPQSPALAVRGNGTARAPLVAEADDVTIVLDVHMAEAGNVALLGQVAADDPDRWAGALVEVRQAGTLRATGEVDDLASFRCAPLPAGTSELRITAPDGTSIVLPEVDLKRSA
jgi:anti-sigma factor RsiW